MDQILLQYGVVTFVALVVILGRFGGGRDLRASDHGLFYQEESSPQPDQNGDAQEMLSFFGATTSSSSVELPEAKNISDTWWSARGAGGEARDPGRDHVRLGLLVASGVCGLTGLVLLVVSGVVFLFRLQKQKLKADHRIPSTSAPISDSTAQSCSQ